MLNLQHRRHRPHRGKTFRFVQNHLGRLWIDRTWIKHEIGRFFIWFYFIFVAERHKFMSDQPGLNYSLMSSCRCRCCCCCCLRVTRPATQISPPLGWVEQFSSQQQTSNCRMNCSPKGTTSSWKWLWLFHTRVLMGLPSEHSHQINSFHIEFTRSEMNPINDDHALNFLPHWLTQRDM